MRSYSIGHINLTFLLLVSFAVAIAQEIPVGLTENGNSKVALGASIATTGPGLNLVLGVSRPLSVRLGFEQMAFNVPFSFEENNIDYDADLKISHQQAVVFLAFAQGGFPLHQAFQQVVEAADQFTDFILPVNRQ